MSNLNNFPFKFTRGRVQDTLPACRTDVYHGVNMLSSAAKEIFGCANAFLPLSHRRNCPRSCQWQLAARRAREAVKVMIRMICTRPASVRNRALCNRLSICQAWCAEHHPAGCQWIRTGEASCAQHALCATRQCGRTASQTGLCAALQCQIQNAHFDGIKKLIGHCGSRKHQSSHHCQY